MDTLSRAAGWWAETNRLLADRSQSEISLGQATCMMHMAPAAAVERMLLLRELAGTDYGRPELGNDVAARGER